MKTICSQFTKSSSCQTMKTIHQVINDLTCQFNHTPGSLFWVLHLIPHSAPNLYQTYVELHITVSINMLRMRITIIIFQLYINFTTPVAALKNLSRFYVWRPSVQIPCFPTCKISAPITFNWNYLMNVFLTGKLCFLFFENKGKSCHLHII